MLARHYNNGYDYVNLCLFIYYVNLFLGTIIGYSPSAEDTILK